MNKGGSFDFDWCKVTCVHAEHSSSLQAENRSIPGGDAVGWVVKFKDRKEIIYHSGSTAVFRDMAIIDELYKPNILILPIGGLFTMGPAEAAFAVKKFFKNAKIVIPMSFNSGDDITPAKYSDFVTAFEEQFKVIQEEKKEEIAEEEKKPDAEAEPKAEVILETKPKLIDTEATLLAKLVTLKVE